MGMGTYEAFHERLSKMKPSVSIDGKKHDRAEDYMRGGLYVMKETIDCAHDPKYEDVCTATRCRHVRARHPRRGRSLRPGVSRLRRT